MSRLMNAALLAGLLAFSLASAVQKPTPDLILYNGKIFTSNAAHPYVQAPWRIRFDGGGARECSL